MCIADLTIPYTSKNRFLVDVGDDPRNGVDKDVMRVTFVGRSGYKCVPLSCPSVGHLGHLSA
jgi:hypothetical protein